MRKRKSKFAAVRHPFWCERLNPDGTTEKIKALAKVRYSRKEVVITLTAAHVRKSIRQKGAGDAARCAVAVCSYDHADAFPHPVNGEISFGYARAHAVSRRSKKTGLPTECVVYEHDADDVAKLNDTRGGQKRLLAILERDGPRTIRFKPHRPRSIVGRPGKGRQKTGARDRTPGKGARLRYAIWKAGAHPSMEAKS